MPGISATGFEKLTLAEIEANLQENAKTEYGQDVKLSNKEVLGIIITLMSDRFAALWDLAEDVYNNHSPETANDTGLDRSASLTGSIREGATKTRVVCTCFGTDGTIIPSDRIVKQPNTENRFLSIETKTIGESVSGEVDIIFEAEEAGDIEALASSITEIVTPVAGWASVNNPADAFIQGQDVESDEDFRARRREEINVAGGGTIEGIADFLRENVADLEDVFIFENDQDIEVDGRPPHSLEIVVDGGDDQDVFDNIWESKGGGIELVGSESGTVTDSMGVDRTIKFSRPTDRLVWLEIDYTTNSDFPASGETDMLNNILAFGNALGIGDDVIVLQMIMQIDVPGLVDLVIRIDLDNPSPTTDDDLVILRDSTAVERSRWDSSRITLTDVT